MGDISRKINDYYFFSRQIYIYIYVCFKKKVNIAKVGDRLLELYKQNRVR